MDELIEPVLTHLHRENPGDVIGVYLYGSGAGAGLRPDSDVDLLVLTRSSLTYPERSSWVTRLLKSSGWKGHTATFPEASERRPLEVTSLVLSDLHPLTEVPNCDFQFGEWLRAELTVGEIPSPTADADVVTILATARSTHRVIHGPALANLIDPVPFDLLVTAQLAAVPGLLTDLAGDEQNSLLTLSRILVTIETGQIVSKDVAARLVADRLPHRERALLEGVGRAYLGHHTANRGSDSARAVDLAQTLSELIRHAAADQINGHG